MCSLAAFSRRVIFDSPRVYTFRRNMQVSLCVISLWYCSLPPGKRIYWAQEHCSAYVWCLIISYTFVEIGAHQVCFVHNAWAPELVMEKFRSKCVASEASPLPQETSSFQTQDTISTSWFAWIQTRLCLGKKSPWRMVSLCSVVDCKCSLSVFCGACGSNMRANFFCVFFACAVPACHSCVQIYLPVFWVLLALIRLWVKMTASQVLWQLPLVRCTAIVDSL